MRVLLILLALTVSASAQTLRDKSGNPIGHYSQEGNRTVFRDNSGNPHGYSEQLSNGTVQFRDNSGNLKATETPR